MPLSPTILANNKRFVDSKKAKKAVDEVFH